MSCAFILATFCTSSFIFNADKPLATLFALIKSNTSCSSAVSSLLVILLAFGFVVLELFPALPSIRIY